MLALQIFLLILGLALLVKGADFLVDGGAGIAKKCKISPLVIGLTIVAFGTSAPELAVSVTSAVKQSTDISIGNVVGSNIVNILLILGVSALVHNLPVQKNSLILDMPVLIVAGILISVLGRCGNSIEWYDGVIMLSVFAAYMALLLVKSKKDQEKLNLETTEKLQEEQSEVACCNGYAAMKNKLWFLFVILIAGLAMVVGGGTLLVDAATYIAKAAGVSERIIGLTIVAIGTSLPELVTSVMAAIKGETDIAVGNIIGSNIFNTLFVAAIASLFYPLAFSTGNFIDSLVALGAAVVLFVLALFNKNTLTKASGAIMLACFVAYYVYLFII